MSPSKTPTASRTIECCPRCGNGLYTNETLRATCGIIEIDLDKGDITFDGTEDVEWDSTESDTNDDGDILIFCPSKDCPNEGGATLAELKKQL